MFRSICTPSVHEFYEGGLISAEGVSDASDTLRFNTFVYQSQLQYKYQEHDKLKCEFPYILLRRTPRLLYLPWKSGSEPRTPHLILCRPMDAMTSEGAI